MWSRKPIPVAMSARPEPSRFSATSTRVSRVSRRMCEVRGDMGACGIVAEGMVDATRDAVAPAQVVEPPHPTTRRWASVVQLVAVACAVLPLFALDVWSGFRIAQTDPVLSVIAATEQPLSVRSPAGLWSMLLALTWFGLAYWQRRMTLWEAALVLVGGAAALARLGNAWIYGLAMLLPLLRQLSLLRVQPRMALVVVFAGIAVTAFTILSTLPPALPEAAIAASRTTSGGVFADWRWAPDLQRTLGTDRRVLASGGLAAESHDFWVDYLRVSQGPARW